MALLEQHPDLREALRGEMTPKFLATRSAAGAPNVVPCISLQPADDEPDTLFFGNFLLRKSIQNLKEDARVGVLVITPELRGWILQCDFVEFQRTGAYVDKQMSGSLLRYNAYTGIRDAGIVRVRALIGAFAISKLQVMTDFLRARFAGARQPANDNVAMPRQVQTEFARMIAVKTLAWLSDDGYPIAIPALSLQPRGAQTLIAHLDAHLPRPPDGASVAANILTFDAISYQVKGVWDARGAIGVCEVYAGGPPIPGERIA